MTEHMRDFDRFAEEYDFWMSTVNGPGRFLGLLKLLPAETASVLDAGCGAGQLALFLADFADHVTGLDISPIMIDRAKQRQAALHKQNVTFLVGDMATTPTGISRYDFVVSYYALHNTDLARVLPNLQRLVRPGGRLFVRDLVTDDAQRWQSATWQRWRAVRNAPVLRRQHGWAAMWRILRFRLSSAWVEHVRHDKILTASAVQAVYACYLPGCVLRFEGQEMTLLWEAPGPTQFTAPAAAPLPAFAPASVPGQTRFQRLGPWPVERFPKRQIETSIVQVFEQQAVRHGDRPAIKAGDKVLTYAELNAAANRLARVIVVEHAAAEEPVAILLSQDTSILVALFAALKAGKAYVALDPSQPAERLRAIMIDAQARVLVTAACHLEELAAIVPARCQIVTMEQLDPDLPAENLALRITPDHPAGIFYTSGSTGEPKGIVRQHRQILHSTWHNTNAYAITAEDRHSLLGFCGHTATVPDIFDTLLNGATLCLFKPRQHSLSDLAEWLSHEQITLFHPPVELFRRFLASLHGDEHFPHVRMVILAGQTVLPQDVTQYRSRFGAACLLLHRLASTETGSVAHLLIDRHTPIGERVPVGYATADKEILILDEERRPVAAGEVGEIAVRSRYLAAGYWRQPELTAAKFLADPAGEDARVYLTGDMGQLAADGLLEHLGRKDLLVKIRGYRVQLDAVEAALRTFPFVRDAAVSVHETAGGGQRLVGYVVPKTAQSPSASELRWHLSRNLPTYMIPTAWMLLDELPLSATGKVNRCALPQPTFTRPDLDTPFIAPRGELEVLLTAIWAELLELEVVGIEDNFFELGGDSILAMRMVLAVEEQLRADVGSDFFQNPTVAHLVRLLGAQTSSPAAPRRQRSSPATARLTDDSIRPHGRLIRGGPLLRGLALPYGLGIRFQRAWLALPGVEQAVFDQEVALLHRWGERVGAPPAAAIVRQSLLANTWRSWRMRVLTAPLGDSPWVTIQGDPTLWQPRQGRPGVMFVVLHSPLSGIFVRSCAASGVQTRMIDGAANETGVPEQDRSAQVYRAYQALRRGEIVVLGGDGSKGAQGVTVPFFGGQRLFRQGGAELAVQTGAPLVPVFCTISTAGQVKIDVCAPLTAEGSTAAARVEGLTHAYADLVVARWPQVYPSLAWGNLARWLRILQEQTDAPR